MKYRNPMKMIALMSLILFLNACGSKKPKELPVEENGYYHSGVYFGSNFSNIYKKGIKDGCTTAKGYYKKSHSRFNSSQEYHDGWFLGRNRCKHLLIMEEKI